MKIMKPSHEMFCQYEMPSWISLTSKTQTLVAFMKNDWGSQNIEADRRELKRWDGKAGLLFGTWKAGGLKVVFVRYR